jgi:hypothetical protein
LKNFLHKIINGLKNRGISFFDTLFYGLKSLFLKKKSENNPIVFICEANMPRMGRMLKYLPKIRKEPFIVFVHKDKYFKKFANSQSGIEYRTYRSRAQLRYKLNKILDIRLIHGVESRSVYPSVGTEIRNTKFIFDYQDLYVNYFGLNPSIKWMKRNLKYEKQCLENASGIIGYSLEYKPAYKMYKIKRKECIYYPFFLDDSNIQFVEKNSLNDIINLVYVGGLSPVDKIDSFNLTLLKKYFEGTNLVLHIYPSPTLSEEVVNGYRAFALVNKNFVFHDSVSQSELSLKLSGYDFGFIPFYKTEGFLSDVKFKYSTTLKMFNYIEAGIPVILMNYTEYQSWFIRHYDLGIGLETEDLIKLSQIVKESDYARLKNNIKNFQSEKTITSNISKISNLYKKVLQEE